MAAITNAVAKPVVTIRGNLLTAHLDYPDIGMVVQQWNSYAIRPHGLSATFADSPAWSWTNRYKQRTPKFPDSKLNMAACADSDPPGTVVVLQQPDAHRTQLGFSAMPLMAGIIGQENMGKPEAFSYRHHHAAEIAAGTWTAPTLPDSKETRVTYFRDALINLVSFLRSARGRHVQAVAFPDQIGCGLAGGDWTVYKEMIERLPKWLPRITVYIVEYDKNTDASIIARLQPTNKPQADLARDDVSGISVLVTGSRTWNESCKRHLEFLVEHAPDIKRAESRAGAVVLTHGSCRGADLLCEGAAVARGWGTNPHRYDRNRYGAQAGEMLNSNMLADARPHYLIAFWHNRSGGTRDCIRQTQAYAKQADSRLRGVFVVQHQGDAKPHLLLLSREAFLTWNADGNDNGGATTSADAISVCVTGSREWFAPDVWPFFQQHAPLSDALHDKNQRVWFHDGGALGADSLAGAAAFAHGWRVRIHVADWPTLGRRAGTVRNQEMLTASQPHHVVAFVRPGSRGTWDMLRRVRAYAQQPGSRLVSVLLVAIDVHGTITTSTWTRESFCNASLDASEPHATITLPEAVRKRDHEDETPLSQKLARTA